MDRRIAQEGTRQLDTIELALIALLNMEAPRGNDFTYPARLSDAMGRQDWVAGNRWRHIRQGPPLLEPWLYGWSEAESRLFTADPGLLTLPVPDLLAQPSAIAFVGLPGALVLKYSAFHPVRKVPAPYFAWSRKAVLYLRDYRSMALDGTEERQLSYHGWHPGTNRYVPIGVRGEGQRELLGVTGEARRLTGYDRDMVVIHASAVEDGLARWVVRVSEVTGVWLSTDGAGIHALAALRDDPRSASGRRSPLLHWVQGHLRRQPGSNDVVEVRRHLRGITTFRLGTVEVDIREPQKRAAPRDLASALAPV